MFTGIIREVGRMGMMERRGESLHIAVICGPTSEDAEIGDSIAVNGVCLTVVAKEPGKVTMDVGEETFWKTNLSHARVGDELNIEPSLKLGDKLGGHIVTGHVDGVGRVTGRREMTTQVTFEIEFPEDLLGFIAKKGSVALDGVSLTAGEVKGHRLETYIIPHTIANTTFMNRRVGDPVNVEVDVLARYVRAALGGGDEASRKFEDLLKKFEYI